MADDILILDPVVPVGDPSLVWALDPRNGAADLSGNGRDGTGAGGITLGGLTDAPPGWNGSTDFDGVANRISSTYSPFTASAFTAVGWAYQQTNAAIMSLLGGDGHDTTSPRLDINTSSAIRFRVRSDLSDATSQATFAAAAPALNTWFHYGFAFDPATDTAKLLINGKLIGTVTGLTAAYATPGNFKLGAWATAAAAPFDGRQAMVSVFPRYLSDGEIASDYERGASKAEKRTELDLTPWVGRGGEGIDWGEAGLEMFKAQQTLGEIPVDARTPNRVIRVPLPLLDRGAVTFEGIRADVIAKTGLIQREAGTLRRGDSDEAMFADVVNATLTMPDDWLTENRDLALEPVLLLEALPDFYGHEVDHGRVTGSNGQTIHTTTAAEGDVPGRVRVLIENLTANAQRGLLYAVRSRQRGDGTDAMVYEAEVLTPLGGAALAALSGASGAGNNVIQHTNLPAASWLAILETTTDTGDVPMAHVGPHEIWARIHDPGTTAGLVKIRLEWFTGDATRPTLNRVVETPLVGGFARVNLGEIIPKRARVGRQTWIGRVLAKADVAGADLSIDKLYVLPIAEGYGRIVASDVAPTPTSFLGRDEFNQSAGALNGKAAAEGGNWSHAGDTAPAWEVDATEHKAKRVAVATDDTGRAFARLGVSAPALSAVAADLGWVIPGSVLTSAFRLGMAARYVDPSNALVAELVFFVDASTPPFQFFKVEVSKIVAGAVTSLGSLDVDPASITVASGDPPQHRYVLGAEPNGIWYLERDGSRLLSGVDAVLATGGALDDGGFALVSMFTAPDASNLPTAWADNFAAWVPALDAALFPSRSAELSSEGYWRRSSDGSASAPIVPFGVLPRMPASGAEGRSVEWLLTMTEGDFDALADVAVAAPAARVLSRPSWLFPPRA